MTYCSQIWYTVTSQIRHKIIFETNSKTTITTSYPSHKDFPSTRRHKDKKSQCQFKTTSSWRHHALRVCIWRQHCKEKWTYINFGINGYFVIWYWKFTRKFKLFKKKSCGMFLEHIKYLKRKLLLLHFEIFYKQKICFFNLWTNHKRIFIFQGAVNSWKLYFAFPVKFSYFEIPHFTCGWAIYFLSINYYIFHDRVTYIL